MANKKPQKPAVGRFQESPTPKLAKLGLLDTLNLVLSPSKIWFWLVPMALTALLGILLFDVKVSVGGDDSGYIFRSWLFVNKGKFPYYQGPGYPLFLAIPVAIFSINLIVLKALSLLAYLGFVYVSYYTFRNKIPNVVLFTSLIFFSINSFLLYYTSQTYTEAFFIFIQSIALWVTLKMSEINDFNLKKHWKSLLAFALVFLYLSITKSVAIICIVAPIIYFTLNGNRKLAVLSFASFAIARGFYELVTKAVFGSAETGQLEGILLKNGYNPELGYETPLGLLKRFFENTETFLSLKFYQILHFTPMEVKTSSKIGAILTVGFFLCILYLSFKNNKVVFLALLFGVVYLAATFVGIHSYNKQERLIIPAIPMMILGVSFGLYHILSRIKFLHRIYLYAMSILIGISVFHSVQKIPDNVEVLKVNLSGDLLYGYENDWKNYLAMSQWCAKNLPEGSRVLARKSTMSFIVSGGRDMFEGLYVVPHSDPDSLYKWVRDRKVTHAIIGNLRFDPSKADGRIINTMHRTIGPIQQTYPEKVQFVIKIGETEPAILYEIK